MSRSYFTEDAKLHHSQFPPWSIDAQMEIEKILCDKGYFINCVSRMGCDRKYHDAWLVERKDIPSIIEELFRQRIVVEVQAEGSYCASINFCYGYSEYQVLDAVKRFRRNKL